MSFSISQSLLKGNAKDLCAEGVAVEFIQPWYTPIETTPVTTGISIGGIGSAYTLTAAADTPVISFVPGLHVTSEEKEAIALQDWYASEIVVESAPKISVANLSAFSVVVDFFPLFDAEGKDLFKGLTEEADIEKQIAACQKNPKFYAENKAQFEAYKTEFSPATQKLMAESLESEATNTAILLDHFAGGVALKTDWQASLSANVESEERLEQKRYAAEKLENSLLYPQAQLDYLSDEHKVKITRRHYSPILRGQLETCSLPLNFIEFDLENPTEETRQVQLVWAQENYAGFSVIKKRPGVQDAGFLLQKTARSQKNELLKTEGFSGVVLGQEKTFGDLNGQMALGLLGDQDPRVSFTARPTLYTSQLADTVEEALSTTRLNSTFDCGVYSAREALSAE